MPGTEAGDTCPHSLRSRMHLKGIAAPRHPAALSRVPPPTIPSAFVSPAQRHCLQGQEPSNTAPHPPALIRPTGSKSPQTNPNHPQFPPLPCKQPRTGVPAAGLPSAPGHLSCTNQFVVLLISLKRPLCGVKGLTQRVSCFTRAEEFLCLQF